MSRPSALAASLAGIPIRIVPGLVAAIAVALASLAWAERADGPSVRVATSGNDSERLGTLPITREPGMRPRSVVSLGPRALGELERGDRVRVTAEVQVTGDCASPVPRCVGRPYHYAPIVRARLVLAREPSSRTGQPIAHLERETCTQKRPQYEHHCVLVFTAAGFDVADPSRLPCPPDACRVNLVADAHHPRARAGDRITVGGLRPDGTIPQDRGRINVVRYRGVAAAAFGAEATHSPLHHRLRPDLKRRTVISKRLPRLAAGEQLAVSARMRLDVGSVPYAVRTSARLILADSPAATRQSAFVKHVALGQGELSESNGSNCPHFEGVCTTRKVGVGELRRDAVDGQGRPVPLYVNLVTVLGPKVRRAHASDRVTLRGAEITVTRFPPELNPRP